MPKENHSWDWASENGKIFLQSKLLLKNKFNHAFFTKRESNNYPKKLILKTNGKHSIHSLNQIHSNHVVKASICDIKSKIDGDGMISDRINQSLWIYTADCIPILIGDREKGNVAAIHSGWRGLASSIIKKTIFSMKKEYDSQSNDLVVALGPSISLFNYEVDLNIIKKIYRSLGENNLIKDKEIIDKMLDLKCISINKNQNNFYLDIRLTAMNQLFNEGLKSECIDVNNNCTYNDSIFFNSWRRESATSRQWSYISCRESKR